MLKLVHDLIPSFLHDSLITYFIKLFREAVPSIYISYAVSCKAFTPSNKTTNNKIAGHIAFTAIRPNKNA